VFVAETSGYPSPRAMDPRDGEDEHVSTRGVRWARGVRHFPLNAWYAAAWDHEVGRNLLAKTIVEHPGMASVTTNLLRDFGFTLGPAVIGAVA
jgi:hypothetical protein